MLKWLGIDVSGFGSEGAILNLLVEVVLLVIIIWKFWLEPKMRLKKGLDRRRIGNPNGKPGSAQECKEHMKKLTELNTEITNIKDDITEIKRNNRDDHKEIFREINKLRR